MPLASETLPLLRLADVTVAHQGLPLIENISLAVRANEIVTLVGPNGAGKSTVIRTAMGLIKPNSGQIHQQPGLRLGYIPQSVHTDSTLPLSVERFLRLGNHPSRADIEQVLAQVGCREILTRPIDAISGGELRRVLLARALLRRPQLLILDEPTSGVDIAGQAALYALIQQIRDQYRCGVLLVSHNLHIVMAATDQVVCLNRHLCCSGTPEDVKAHPQFANLFGNEAHHIGIYRHQHDHEHDIHGHIHRH